MHMKHHQRSITLMGCLDELNRTHKLQRNLNNIYTHNCACQGGQVRTNREGGSGSGEGERMNRTINFGTRGSRMFGQTNGHCNGSPNHHHDCSHVCLVREEQNRKLSELHRKGYLAGVNKKSKQVLQQNKKIVDKLINVKSELQQLYNPPQQKSFLNIGTTYPINPRSKAPKNFVSSSAVNRNKLFKRIESENKNINKRLESAMAKSSYSQEKLRKWSKMGSGYGSGYGIGEEEMRKTMSQIQGRRKNVLLERAIAKDRKTQMEMHMNGQEHDLLRTQTQKSQLSNPNYNMYYQNLDLSNPHLSSNIRFQTEPSPNRNSNLKPTSLSSKNELTRLYENSINYVQSQQYKYNPSPNPNASPGSNTQYRSSRGQLTNEKIVNRLKISTGTGNPAKQEYESESIVKMRKAAMLHFRKVQKMKATQSRVWQIKGRERDRAGAGDRDRDRRDYYVDVSGVSNQDIIGDRSQRKGRQEDREGDNSILLTGVY